MLHPVLPDIEIGMSKQAIALMISQHGHITPYKIKPKDGFFVINDTGYVGLHIINDKYRFMWNGRTSVYLYAEGNMTPIDPIKIDILNQYKKANRLVQVTQKDIRDGARIRHLANQLQQSGQLDRKAIMDKIVAERTEEGNAIQNAIAEHENRMNAHIQFKKEKHGQDVSFTPEQKAVIMINYIFQNQLIDEKERDLLIWKVENEKITFESLVSELKHRRVVSVAEPLPENVEDFLQDLQMQYEGKVASIIQNHRRSKRGLKQYRQPQVKQFISSLVLASLVIIPTMIPLVLALIGFIHMFDLRYLALGGIALIILMGRYHFPLTLPPVALVFYPGGNIRPFKVIRGAGIFIMDYQGMKNVYALNSRLRLMWGGKIPCYLFNAETSDKVSTVLQESEILVSKRRFKK